jgi:hypothetical protein
MPDDRRSGCAAADKVDDFEAVVGGERGVGPLGARDDLAVTLDGDAVRGKTKLGEEPVERGVGREREEGARLTVQLKRQRHTATE